MKKNQLDQSRYDIILQPGKKIYFASDMHLGLHPFDKNKEREKVVVRWLDEIKNDAQELFLLGDIFDFWYEYKKVVSRGFTRFLGKLAELSDHGVKIHYFTGNHDVWVFDYLPKEIGIIIHRKPLRVLINGLHFFLGHGDGLGPKDHGYKLLKKIFNSTFLQFLFSRLHPNFAYMIGHTWSRHSRLSKGLKSSFKGEDKEYLIVFSRQMLQKEHFDYFIFGHRHIAMDIKLNEKSHYINLGEWIKSSNYAVFDGFTVALLFFSSQ